MGSCWPWWGLGLSLYEMGAGVGLWAEDRWDLARALIESFRLLCWEQTVEWLEEKQGRQWWACWSNSGSSHQSGSRWEVVLRGSDSRDILKQVLMGFPDRLDVSYKSKRVIQEGLEGWSCYQYWSGEGCRRSRFERADHELTMLNLRWLLDNQVEMLTRSLDIAVRNSGLWDKNLGIVGL